MSDPGQRGRDLSDVLHEACRESPEAMLKAFDQGIGTEIATTTAVLRKLHAAEEKLAAATERAGRLEAAGNSMAEAIRHGLRDGLRDCGEGCEHPACRLMRAEKRWRALVGAGEGS